MLSRYIILFIVCILLSVGFAQNRKITIAVIKDGPSSEEALISKIEANLDSPENAKQEITELLKSMRHAMDNQG